MNICSVFVAGGTGYIGRRLIPTLAQRNHRVCALVRRGSERKIPPGCSTVPGDPLEPSSFVEHIPPADTFIHLVGVAHPGPAKGEQFRKIDLVSVRASVHAAKQAGVRHFVYMSVAQPAPVMREYQAVRAEGERVIAESGMNGTMLRPWYVLGPGHRWMYAAVPAYWVLERFQATRGPARRLGLVTLPQMIQALVSAVENPPEGIRIAGVPEIRSARVQAREIA